MWWFDREKTWDMRWSIWTGVPIRIEMPITMRMCFDIMFSMTCFFYTLWWKSFTFISVIWHSRCLIHPIPTFFKGVMVCSPGWSGRLQEGGLGSWTDECSFFPRGVTTKTHRLQGRFLISTSPKLPNLSGFMVPDLVSRTLLSWLSCMVKRLLLGSKFFSCCLNCRRQELIRNFGGINEILSA